jgi:DnaJ family protein A protein 2
VLSARKLSKFLSEKHPEPEPTDNFQKISEAYDILKDPEKRRRYDQYGFEGLREEPGGGMDDIFGHLFGRRFGGGGGGGAPQRARTRDIEHKISVTLEDLYNGKEVALKITRDVICLECGGSGCMKGKSPNRCGDCDGRGRRVQTVRMGPMITQQVVQCPKCNGAGEWIDAKDRCPKCHGKKVVEEKKPVTVHVEQGMEDGERLVFQGHSDEAPGADTGDLVVSLSMKQHSQFLRKHDHLLVAKKITLAQALFGKNLVIKHLDGRKLVVPCAGKVIAPGSVKMIAREGIPQRGNTFEKGNLFIKFEVEFPKSSQLKPELKTAVLAALPLPNETADVDENEDNVHPVTMRDSDLKQFESTSSSRSGERRRESYSRDDDEPRGHTASCQPM